MRGRAGGDTLGRMRYAAFLRGINLGPNRKLGMPELRLALAGAGLEEVQTYLRSGNVVVTSGDDPATLSSRIGEVIADEFDMRVGVVVRTMEELDRVRDLCPYRQEAESDPTRVHAVFVDPDPPSHSWDSIDPARFEPDRFAVGEGVVYLHLPDGMARAKLPAEVERAARPSLTTTRNWRTVEAVAGLR